MGRHELWAELMKLTLAERVELVEDLWDSIAQDSLPPLSSEELAEMNRRLAEHRRDPSTAITWDEVLDHVKARLRSRPE